MVPAGMENSSCFCGMRPRPDEAGLVGVAESRSIQEMVSSVETVTVRARFTCVWLQVLWFCVSGRRQVPDLPSEHVDGYTTFIHRVRISGLLPQSGGRRRFDPLRTIVIKNHKDIWQGRVSCYASLLCYCPSQAS